MITCDSVYAVRQGDTLGTISQAAYGTTQRYRDLYAINRATIGPDINVIEIGMLLSIPCLRNSATAGSPEAGDATAQATAPTTERVEIVFNKASAPRYVINAGVIDPFLADIRRATQGRVAFTDPAEINRDPKAQLDIVRDGTVDGAYIFNGLLAETHPLVQLPMHPMTGGTALQTAIALWRVHDRYFRGGDDFSDVHLLGFVAAPPAQIWQIPTATASEGSTPAARTVQAIPYFDGPDADGAEAVRADIADRLRQTTETGNQDTAAFAMTHGIARATGTWTDARAVIEIEGGVFAPTFSVFISKAKWDQISPADQKAINKLAGEALAQRSTLWDSADAGDKLAMQRRGLNVLPADGDLRAALQDQARVGWETWIGRANAAGIDGFSAIEAFFQEMRTLRQAFPSGS